MKMTFRWYGEKDPVTLSHIRQIPVVDGVVTALYHIPVGEVWDEKSILDHKKTINNAGLSMEVIESVPVHEEIKLGSPVRDKYIAAYCENIKNLGKAGVKVICYNFMPVFDWVRSELHYVLPDGSNALAYSQATLDTLDPRKQSLSLPGWDESYTKEQLSGLLRRYEEIDEEKLRKNMIYFLSAVIPECEKYGVKMAVHPDDPPWGLFGLPRIIRNEETIDTILSAVDSPANGLTFCTGSLGADRSTDLVRLAGKYAARDRIGFVHARNIRFENSQNGLFFHESPHPTECGSLDIFGILRALHDNGFDGYIRPDHGRNIWGEDGRPGYGLYDRALGAMYLSGVWEALEKD